MKQTCAYAACAALVAVLLAGCGGINALLKSGRPEEIYAKAMENYEKEKWQRASTLFEGVQHYYAGSTREDSISFFNARCKYKNRDYDTASVLLDEFRRKFGRSAFIEDAEGMYAMCFYYLSPGPTRDQTMTGQALIAVNEFMSRYPQSEQVANFRKIDAELTERLHDKAYINAYTYYKNRTLQVGHHGPEERPEGVPREQAPRGDHVPDRRRGLPLRQQPVDEAEDRHLQLLDSSLSFREEFPESKHIREVERMTAKARDFLARNKKEDNI